MADFNAMACVAGRMSFCHAVISQLVEWVKKLRKERKAISRGDIMGAIDQSRALELRRVYDWSIRGYLGCYI